MGGVRPLAQRLKFQRVGGNVGNIELFEDLNGGIIVVIGRATDKAKASEGDHRINFGTVGIAEVIVDCRTSVQTTCKAWDNAQTARLEGADHRVIMGRIRAQNIRAHHQQTDSGHRIFRARQIGDIGGDAARDVRVIQPNVRIFDRGGRFGMFEPSGIFGITVQQIADHCIDIVVRAAQPILHGYETTCAGLGTFRG